MTPRQPLSTLFPYTTLFRSFSNVVDGRSAARSPAVLDFARATATGAEADVTGFGRGISGMTTAGALTGSSATRVEMTCFFGDLDRKSTRLNSSHSQISYAVF